MYDMPIFPFGKNDFVPLDMGAILGFEVEGKLCIADIVTKATAMEGYFIYFGDRFVGRRGTFDFSPAFCRKV
jgi:hypothetical protein